MAISSSLTCLCRKSAVKAVSFFSSASRAFRSTSILSISFWRMDMRSASADIGVARRIDLLAHDCSLPQPIGSPPLLPEERRKETLHTVAYPRCRLTPALRTCTRRPTSPPACPESEGKHHGPARDPAASEPGRRRGIPDRRLAALGPLPRRHAPPRRPVRGPRRRARAERPRLQGRARPRRPHASPGRSTTCSPASSRPRGSRSTRGSAPSSSSTRAPATAPASAASRPTARSASR